MANPQKGEVTFEAKGRTYTLKMGTNALAALEGKVKMPAHKFFARKGTQFGTADTIAVLWAALYRHHKLTTEEVGDLIDEVGQEKIAKLILDAQVAASANTTEGAKGGARPTPKARANGTGTA